MEDPKQTIKLYTPFYDDKTPPNKKYSVLVKIKTDDGKSKIKRINFGDSNMEQFRDSTGLGVWSHLDHGDKKRRQNYLRRAKGIKNKAGELTYKDKTSPNYYSVRYLW